MNRSNLIEIVSSASGITKAQATDAVDAMFGAISDALKGGSEVRLIGFGTFSSVIRSASEGRNPRTGEKIQIAASRQPKFKASKVLKDALN